MRGLYPNSPIRLHGVAPKAAQGQIYLQNNVFVPTHGQLPSTVLKGTRFIRSTAFIRSGYVMTRNFPLYSYPGRFGLAANNPVPSRMCTSSQNHSYI